nr:heme exporter protein CcmB [Candidatus Acidoferrales bacterium]
MNSRAKSVSLTRAIASVFAKELRVEFRSFELLTSTIVFALIVVFVFSFAFNPSAADSRRFGAGFLWIALLFASSLMLQPSFTRERANDSLAALVLAPIDPFAIIAGKLFANFFFLILVELILLPAFSVLYNVPLLGIIGPLAGVMLLGTFGIATVGTVFAAIASQARMRELLLPLLLLPALVPLLIASVGATMGLLSDSRELPSAWVAVMVCFDIMFFTAAWLFGGYLLEE